MAESVKQTPAGPTRVPHADGTTGGPRRSAAGPMDQRLPTGSVRELITELAAVEDALRRTPALLPGGDVPGSTAGLNPRFAALVHRERRVVAALRARRTQTGVATRGHLGGVR